MAVAVRTPDPVAGEFSAEEYEEGIKHLRWGVDCMDAVASALAALEARVRDADNGLLRESSDQVLLDDAFVGRLYNFIQSVRLEQEDLDDAVKRMDGALNDLATVTNELNHQRKLRKVA